MSTKTFEWSRIKVTVTSMGSDRQPWSTSDKCSAVRYEVKIEAGLVSYATSAWGSINEHQKWLDAQNVRHQSQMKADELLDYQGMAVMLVEELSSALDDPDEYLECAVGDKKGMDALNALRNGERTILMACRFGSSITEAAEQIRKEGVL